MRDGFDRFGLLDDRVRFLQGRFDDTLARRADRAASRSCASARGLGDDGRRRARAPLRPRRRSAASSSSRTTSSRTVATAIEAFRARARHHRAGRAGRIGPASAWRKDAEAARTRADDATPRERVRSARRSRRRRPTDAIDLSVVVVFYNMRREAARTLHSLSRAYQQGIDDLDYEVIVVENGSHADQRLGEEFVRELRAGVPLHRPRRGRHAVAGRRAEPRHRAPAAARRLALMIDGAHVLTPGVLQLRHGRAADATNRRSSRPSSGTSARASRATRSTTATTRSTRTSCSGTIDWPRDGYRLFEIGHFIGDRDWFDGVWESNCLFVPATLLEQVGGFDESFSMPGGGYANLELYERLGSSPGRHVVTHPRRGLVPPGARRHDDQRRRAATTAGARSFSYGEHYRRAARPRFRGPGKPIHYVGTMSAPGSLADARAAHVRRRRSPARAVDDGPDGVPDEPDADARGAEDRVHRGVLAQPRVAARRPGSGTRSPKTPTDLLAYQELIAAVRPDWIIETGTGNGGRALFLARSASSSATARSSRSSDERRAICRRAPAHHLRLEPAAHEATAGTRARSSPATQPARARRPRLATPRSRRRSEEFDAVRAARSGRLVRRRRETRS